MGSSSVIERMDAILSVVRERMKQAPDNPHMQYAEIMWMTQEELEEFHWLRSRLPSSGLEAMIASGRIRRKIKARR